MAFCLEHRLEGVRSRHKVSAGENLVGSDPSCDIVLDDPSVSRHHAVVVVGTEWLEVADLGSANGTAVDGRTLAGKTRVTAGQQLAFGSVETTLETVESDDFELAARFLTEHPPQESATHQLEPRNQTTASMGPVQRFTLGFLPRLLQTASHQRPLPAEVGSALYSSIPCRAVQISIRPEGTSQDAILFTAGEAKHGEKGWERVLFEPYQIAVRFDRSSRAQLFRPILESCAILLTLGSRQAAVAPAEAPTHEVAAPNPPSLDPQVQQIYQQAGVIARSSVSVLIRGESGTGKEVLARFLHRASPCASRPFVAVNCAALPKDLLEAELFGIERGVATGVDARAGKFEQADGGTLFLDEIGDMALEVQAKILRALQEGEVYRLGANQPSPSRVRIIAATNNELDDLLDQGTFRRDLYHRVADWEVTLPALRDRAIDIPNLAAFFIEEQCQQHGRMVQGLSKAALRALIRYSWPGNIRQLEREIGRAFLFCSEGGLLDSSHLQQSIRDRGRTLPHSLRDRMLELERQEISTALALCDGNAELAAKELQVPLSTFYRKLKQFDVGE